MLYYLYFINIICLPYCYLFTLSIYRHGSEIGQEKGEEWGIPFAALASQILRTFLALEYD